MNKVRVKRIRRLVSRLNKARRAQAKKIDILCKDMVQAHSDFVDKLKVLNFAADFYESLLSENDLAGISKKVAHYIRSRISGSSVAVFITGNQDYNIHLPNENEPVDVDVQVLEDCFNHPLVDCISRANRICSLDDMAEMGLDTEADIFKRISAVAIPIKSKGPGIGFLLIYCSAQNKFCPDQLQKIIAVVPGLYNAIKSVSAVSMHA